MKTAKTTILIDERNREDILNEFGKLSANYVPEWRFTREDPDIGSTLGIVYANQVEENINRVNQIVDRYHSEFVNLLDLSVNSAKPAESICLMELVQDTIQGTVVEAGTRLVSGVSKKGTVNLPTIFETTENVFITGSKIRSSFMTDGEDGSIIPLLGQLHVPELLIPYKTEEEDEETDTEDILNYLSGEESILPDDGYDPTKPLFGSFTLFGEKGGIQQNALLFYHSYLFDEPKDCIFVRINGNDKLIREIDEGQKKFFYSSEGKLIPVEEIRLLDDGQTFALVKNEKEDKQKIDNSPYSMLALIDSKPIVEDEEVAKIQFSAKGAPHTPSFVGSNTTDMDPNDFKPFGEVMEIYQECYIGDEGCFGKKGAKVTMEFSMEFGSKTETLTVEEEEEELKIVKRKPKNVINSIPAEVFAQEVSVEYFNGIGYRKLAFDQEVRFLFAQGQAAKVVLSFMVPEDFEDTEVGGFSGKAIRIQLLKADNCYLRPAVHHYPRITGLKIRYSYEDRYMNPEYLYSFFGTKKVNMTGLVNKGEKFTAFRRTGYEQDALYIGLDKRPENGPVTLFFKLKEGKRYEPLKLKIEYSSRSGFKRLKVIDDTICLSKSGIVSFIPPTDFYEKELEGNREFWIRIVRAERDSQDLSKAVLPKIEDVRLNGVRVMNIETQAEEEYYIDAVTPGARFSLGYDGILDAEVWVNEFDVRTPLQMREMIAENPRIIRTEYDIQGNISSFYVKYTEVERFDNCTDKRVYILDRLSHELIFGDGIHTYTPSTITDAALKVRVRCSDGSLGNVGEYEISGSLSEMLFIGNIYNPIKGYGGSDMETVDSALIRGANIISGRRRLISMKDYIREIEAFSDLIHQVVCVRDYDSRGFKEDGALTFLLLLKDYRDGSYSFHKMEEDLRNHLLKNCEMTIPSSKLYLAEPVFVELSVVAWVRANRMHDSFEIQNSIVTAMEEYFDPALENGEDWIIGTLPTPSQIQMRINIFKHEAVIENVTVLARYTDAEGYHEKHLRDVEATPFMICVSGKHEIHVEI